ncbi:type IV secretory system conjugative DNA transfer family protein [Nocardia yamanashiensis]|uniref:type IV secretory system conjugative DNA transfer family protein n=1 Tax=Nocardia yamanashiensis TaxID=209247 RepID=UPI000A7F906D|nr:TraM recognition domain-containing protein [Nocardia yamanashiensis]
MGLSAPVPLPGWVGVREDVSVHPMAMITEIAAGQADWTRDPVRVGVVGGALVLVVVVWGLVHRWRGRGRLPIDEKADALGTGAALRFLTEEGVRERARVAGVRVGREDPAGLPLGVAVGDGRRLFGSFEDLYLDIWGPRQGKSSARAVPAVLHAIGAVIATTADRRLVDATRAVREAKGSPVRVFDPEGRLGDEPTWYWDPLAWVAGDRKRAAHLAGHFAHGELRNEARDYFDIEGEELLAGLFLAASLDSRPIVQVWDWIANPMDSEPVELLRVHGRNFAAAGIAAIYNTDERTRSGIFGTAKVMVRCLQYTDMHPWITPGGNRIRFDESDFLDRLGTLYCVATQGHGSAAPLVGALTEAVLDVAMSRALASPGARLHTPVVAVLDDAADTLRWNDFPQRCGRFGAHGITTVVLLQSWAQGIRCWGPRGMNELWSAATLKVLGPGIDDAAFLRDRADTMGTEELTAADLRALPRGRAVLFPAGAPPTLIRTEPWWDSPYADEVRRSLTTHAPGHAPTTLTDLINTRPSLNPVTGSDDSPPPSPQPPGIDDVRPL